MFFGFKKKNNSSSSTSNSTPVKTETTTLTSSSAKVVLSKAEDGLERHIVRLKKEKNIDLSSHRARVFVVMDRSGSMTSLYQSGEIQNVLTRLLPLALKFDDNGELEVYVFNTSCIQMPSMNLSNYESYVKREIMNKGYGPSGGTSYSPVIEKTMSIYDDGSSYKLKIFYQFVGIGSENFRYLQKLDDLDGRDVDNTAFIKVSDFARLDDEQLYAKLLEQYPQWLIN